MQPASTNRPMIVGLFTACCLLLANSSVQAADSPYVLQKKVFKKQVKSLSLAPLQVPDMLVLAPAMRTLLESEATRRLEKTKINVTGIQPYAEIVTLFTEQVGGLRNAEGNIDKHREALVRDHARREMRLRHPVDGFAEISLRVVNAAFADDRAQWDGVKQKVKKSGDGFSLFGGKDYQGNIAAVSFQLSIYDRSDALLFSQRGGVEVLQERKGPNLVLLPLDSLLGNEKRLKKAVQLAFKSL